MQPAEGQKPYFNDRQQIQDLVTGGSNNNYYSYGGMKYGRSVLMIRGARPIRDSGFAI
jgi:hypothetical protein